MVAAIICIAYTDALCYVFLVVVFCVYNHTGSDSEVVVASYGSSILAYRRVSRAPTNTMLVNMPTLHLDLDTEQVTVHPNR